MNWDFLGDCYELAEMMLKSSIRHRHVSHCCSKPLIEYYNFVWHIDNFPVVVEMEQRIRSSIFPAQSNSNIKWFLSINPKHYWNNIPVFLNFSLSHSNAKVNASVKLCLIDKNGKRFNEMSYYPYCFNEFNHTMGLYDFIRRETIFEEKNLLLKNNNLTIKCEVRAIIKTLTFCNRSSLVDTKCNLPQELGQLLRDKVLSDVTLCIDGKELEAHKAILAARSPIFAAMFRNCHEKSASDKVIITDVAYDVMDQTLSYIYTGSIGQLAGMSKDLLIAADKYGIEDLKRTCAMYLTRNLTVKNCTDVLVLADAHNAQWLKDSTISYIRSNFKDVMATDDWVGIAKTHHYLEVEVLRSLVNL